MSLLPGAKLIEKSSGVECLLGRLNEAQSLQLVTCDFKEPSTFSRFIPGNIDPKSANSKI